MTDENDKTHSHTDETVNTPASCLMSVAVLLESGRPAVLQTICTAACAVAVTLNKF